MLPEGSDNSVTSNIKSDDWQTQISLLIHQTTANLSQLHRSYDEPSTRGGGVAADTNLESATDTGLSSLKCLSKQYQDRASDQSFLEKLQDDADERLGEARRWMNVSRTLPLKEPLLPKTPHKECRELITSVNESLVQRIENIKKSLEVNMMAQTRHVEKSIEEIRQDLLGISKPNYNDDKLQEIDAKLSSLIKSNLDFQESTSRRLKKLENREPYRSSSSTEASISSTQAGLIRSATSTSSI